MCTISFTFEELDILLDALASTYLYIEKRLYFLSPEEFGSVQEIVLRRNYDSLKNLLKKLNGYGKFE